MKKLLLRKQIFLSAALFCTAGTIATFVIRFSAWEYCAVFGMMGGTLMTAFFCMARKMLIAAEVIAENTIIHIRLADLSWKTDEEKREAEKLCERFDVRISTFGILLGNRIIRWGDGSVWLKSAEIGSDYISLHYGSQEEAHNIRLLYPKPDGGVLADIIEKFRVEAGIIPTVAN